MLCVRGVLYAIRDCHPALCVVTTEHFDGVALQIGRADFRAFRPSNGDAGICLLDDLRFACREYGKETK